MSIFNPIYETRKRKGLLGKKEFKKQSYHRYLKTNAWEKTRNKIRDRDGVCVRCGSKEFLQVNHKSYTRVGGEILSDLELLCDSCHKKFHHL